jgi:hypothetical protein
VRCLSFLVRLASHLAISSGKITPPWVAAHTSKTLQHEHNRHQKRHKLTQSSRNEPEQTHLGDDDPIPQGKRAGARVPIYPESKDPPDPGIDLRIHQLDREGAVMAARPWIPPHCHLPTPEWLDKADDVGAEEVHAHQPILEKTLEDVMHRL